MSEHSPAHNSGSDGIPVSPSLELVAESAQVPPHVELIDRRVLFICAIAILLGIVAAVVAQILVGMITLITNFCYFGTLSLQFRSPAEAIPKLGAWSIFIPVGGALVIGFIARYGSKAIRGHGIPEAMEQVLTNESRIPARITFLKPLSTAISIGTGGPFGAEGPIIATGGALGSVVGQFTKISVSERKTLLASGAAAGMSATFGCPVSAVLLAIELLLFEFRPRSIIPVALATSAAAGLRIYFEGMEPAFQMNALQEPSEIALAVYVLLGGLMGLFSVIVTKIVYGIEDAFEMLPIHWMWWPALGAIVVGVVGCLVPETLGVGYENISHILSNSLPASTIFVLCSMKFISWSVALGSGTAGGTLAPLFTIGGGIGALVGTGVAKVAPWLGVDPGIAALVGMAAIFSGASRAMLASAVFAFETTLQPVGLLPLLGGCAASYLISSLLMRNSIMTEKIARRGIRPPSEYLADTMDQVLVSSITTRDVVTISSDQTVDQVRQWLTSPESQSHQGYPIITPHGVLIGIITRRDLKKPSLSGSMNITELVRSPVKFVYEDTTVKQAADHLVNHQIGRLPVMTREHPPRLVGIITRSDILSVLQRQVRESLLQEPTITFPKSRTNKKSRT